MKVQVIGIQKLSFPDSVTGELIQMTKLHCVGTEKEVSQEMNGQRCEAIGTRLDCSGVEVGGFYHLIYDRSLGSSASAKAKLSEIVPA